jgi:hypothetical protein
MFMTKNTMMLEIDHLNFNKFTFIREVPRLYKDPKDPPDKQEELLKRDRFYHNMYFPIKYSQISKRFIEENV